MRAALLPRNGKILFQFEQMKHGWALSQRVSPVVENNREFYCFDRIIYKTIMNPKFKQYSRSQTLFLSTCPLDTYPSLFYSNSLQPQPNGDISEILSYAHDIFNGAPEGNDGNQISWSVEPVPNLM